MEYLSMVIGVVQTFEGFKYHFLCRQEGLSWLIFALLMTFCYGNVPSVTVLMRVFLTFSATFGLCMNNNKSHLYANGVRGCVLREIVSLTGMKMGIFPFKYLRVLITAKKLSILDCSMLVERIIFILPKTIIKKIEDICRNFLWKGTYHYMIIPLIA
ncbi:hypothetical protein RND81_05G153900 [Saponaria officinalis]|uniref:Uncharacterized protein n=1 Tax=Saponaria officinalis TaxID=3572 RepID=A0AAW1L198_SAPOF